MRSTRERFEDAVEKFGGRRAVAEKLGVTDVYIGQLINGTDDKKPGRDLSYAIEDLLGIPARAWSDIGDGKDKQAAGGEAA